MPNWYVASAGETPMVIESTVGEGLDFVGPITTMKQYRRSSADTYDPYTPEDRLNIQKPKDLGMAPLCAIPTPVNCNLMDNKDIDLKDPEQWVIVAADGMDFETKYLSGWYTKSTVFNIIIKVAILFCRETRRD
jgi:hypothetical protein